MLDTMESVNKQYEAYTDVKEYNTLKLKQDTVTIIGAVLRYLTKDESSITLLQNMASCVYERKDVCKHFGDSQQQFFKHFSEIRNTNNIDTIFSLFVMVDIWNLLRIPDFMYTAVLLCANVIMVLPDMFNQSPSQLNISQIFVQFQRSGRILCNNYKCYPLFTPAPTLLKFYWCTSWSVANVCVVSRYAFNAFSAYIVGCPFVKGEDISKMMEDMPISLEMLQFEKWTRIWRLHYFALNSKTL